MNTEEYIAQMKALGIDRAGLQHGMPMQTPGSPAALHEPALLPGADHHRIGERIKPPPEDLTHLNTAVWKRKHGIET